MAVETTNAFSGPFLPNGATLVFPFTFTAPSPAEVEVVLRTADGTETIATGYTVALTPGGGGSVTFAVAPAAGPELFIRLDPFFTQQIEFENGSAWLAEPVNESADRAALRDIWLRDRVLRAIGLPFGEQGIVLPPAAERVGKFISFLLDGRAVMSPGTGSDPALRGELLEPGGSERVTYTAPFDGAEPRPMQDVIKDLGVSVADFGAHPSLPDNRAAIQAALDSGAKRIYFPSGSYYCSVNAGPLNVTFDQQHLIGLGDVNIFRDHDGPLLTSAAGDLVIENIAFWGQSQALGYEGDLVVLTGVRARLVRSSCRDAGFDLVLKMTGTRSKIESDKDGYYGNVQIGEAGAVCLYPHVSSVYISQALTLVETGVAKIEGGVIAGLNIEKGAGGAGSHGPKISGTRIVGNLNVRQTFTTICGGATVSGNVVVGDGVNPLSNIAFDPTFDQAAGSFTINANVSQSVFFLGAVVDAGLALTINSPINQIWHPPIVYAPALTAPAGTPAIGNGSLSGTIARYGYERRVSIQLSVGSTTDLGSGTARVSVPDTAGGSGIASGAGRIFQAGVGHKPIIAEISPDTARMIFYSSTTAGAFGGQSVDDAFPIAFGDGDAIIASVCYSVK